MNENSQNPFSMWTDMNKNMFGAWNNWVSQTMPQMNKNTSDNADNPVNAYFEFLSKNFSQNPMFSGAAMFSENKNMMEQMCKQWQDGLKNMSALIPNQAAKDAFDRLMNSYQLYNGLQSYWDMFLKNMPSDVKDWNSFMKPTPDKLEKLNPRGL